MAGRKIFVGSLPDRIDDLSLRTEFSKYGQVEDVFVSQNCQPGRQWAFVTFATTDQANLAKDSCDRILHFPGSDRPCDVMLAKNQGMFGQEPLGSTGKGGQMEGAPKKIFVGSLPDGCQDFMLRTEFSRFGAIEEIFIKQNCEPGRQWAFVSFQDHAQAQAAVHGTNGILQFPGSMQPCEVTLARNQGMFGQGSLGAQPQGGGLAGSDGPKKIFVGSLPDGCQDYVLRNEFSRYGTVEEIFMKPNCEPGRQWAFVSFMYPDQAHAAIAATNNVLQFPGSVKACEVMMARNQGMFGQDPMRSGAGPEPSCGVIGGHGAIHHHQPGPHHTGVTPPMSGIDAGPKKIFVGSLPDQVSETVLRAEFSKYGQIVDVFVKANCEPGRQWAFVTFADARQAQHAKDSCDRVLMFPGGSRACDVTLARNQGKFGQESMEPAATPHPHSRGAPQGHLHQQSLAVPPGQPPPPPTPPPPHLTPWREYKTVSGIPYYHNHSTGATQWECPPDLQPAGGGAGHHGGHHGGGGGGRGSHGRGGGRYSPY